LEIVLALIACDGMGFSMQQSFLKAAYRSSRDVGNIATTI